MKRDPRLRGLSSDHHHALALARSLMKLVDSGQADARAARQLGTRFEHDLEPHFETEEEVLLTALRRAGELSLVQRTETDHAFLREHATSASAGLARGLQEFAERLIEHVRFEERDLFPCCEARLEDAVLDEVARRAPKRA